MNFTRNIPIGLDLQMNVLLSVCPRKYALGVALYSIVATKPIKVELIALGCFGVNVTQMLSPEQIAALETYLGEQHGRPEA